MTIKRFPPGFEILIKYLKLFSSIGTITNFCIMFFTNEKILRNVSFEKKLLYIIIGENVIVLITKLFSFENSLPNWFQLREEIFLKYIMNYGKKLKKD